MIPDDNDYKAWKEIFEKKLKPVTSDVERRILDILEESDVYASLQGMLQRDGINPTYTKTEVSHWPEEDLFLIGKTGGADLRGKQVQVHFGSRCIKDRPPREVHLALTEGEHIQRTYEVTRDGGPYSTDHAPKGYVLLPMRDMLTSGDLKDQSS